MLSTSQTVDVYAAGKIIIIIIIIINNLFFKLAYRDSVYSYIKLIKANYQYEDKVNR